MKTYQRLPAPALRPEYCHDWALRAGPLKRNFGLISSSGQQGSPGYPSPPMSNPPSPIRTYPELSTATITEARPDAETSSISSFPAGRRSPLPVTTQISSLSSQTSLPPTTPILQFIPIGSQTSSTPPFRSGQSTSLLLQPTGDEAQTVGTSTTRAGRKSKAHVASACINCKRAHLSCDVRRPCTRCIATGKQDTCMDVQHKKRGRPRLREEGDLNMERMMPEQSMALAGSSTAIATSARPIEATRHRRTESLRSLRSQASDSSSGAGVGPSSFSTPAGVQRSFSYHIPRPRDTSLTPAEIPTAYLDLDFVFIRANRPFEQIMSFGQSIVGRRVGDLVHPVDGVDLSTIRGQLRVERDAREPLYMPPIQQTGVDPLQGVSEVDVDRLTHGFDDRTYLWTRDRPDRAPETFPARIRLAKAFTYFAVVTLPSFGPVESLPQNPPAFAVPYLAAGPSSAATQPTPRAQLGPQPAPSPLYYPSYTTESPQQQSQYYPSQPAAPRMYPPPIPPPALPTFQQQQQSYPPYTSPPSRTVVPVDRFPPAESFVGPTPYSPRFIPSSQRQESPVQLPPIRSQSPSTVAGAAAEPRRPVGTNPGDTATWSEGGSEESPRKRRRMGINDVLQD